MKGKNLITVALTGGIVFLLSACVNTPPGQSPPGNADPIPEVCGLADGDTVRSLTINNDSPIELGEGESESLSVTVNLDAPASEAGIVCIELKDSEIVRGEPLAVGFVIVPDGQSSATSSVAFDVICIDRDVEGRVNPLVTAFVFGGDASDVENSSRERSTRVRAQELRGIQTFLGAAVGTVGEKSQRIRVRCD